jgi:hypothetical protein
MIPIDVLNHNTNKWSIGCGAKPITQKYCTAIVALNEKLSKL